MYFHWGNHWLLFHWLATRDFRFSSPENPVCLVRALVFSFRGPEFSLFLRLRGFAVSASWFFVSGRGCACAFPVLWFSPFAGLRACVLRLRVFPGPGFLVPGPGFLVADQWKYNQLFPQLYILDAICGLPPMVSSARLRAGLT